MKIPLLEQETVINYNEKEKTASVYTFRKPLIRKLEELTKNRPQEAKLLRTYPDGAREYEVPKAWVKIHPPRIYSEEQKAAMVERGRALRNGQVAFNGGTVVPSREPNKTE